MSACSAYTAFFDSVFFADTCNASVFINSSVSSTYFCVSSKRGWVNGTILWSVSIKQKLWGFYNCKIIKIQSDDATEHT